MAVHRSKTARWLVGLTAAAALAATTLAFFAGLGAALFSGFAHHYLSSPMASAVAGAAAVVGLEVVDDDAAQVGLLAR